MRKFAMIAAFIFAPVAFADSASSPGHLPAQSPPDSVGVTHGMPATRSLPAVDIDAVPLPCQSIAKLTASPSPDVALSSRVSLANCMVEQRLRPLSLIDCEKSVREAGDAATPSLQLLDDVIAAGEPSWKMIALHAKGDMMSNLSIRMLTTVPQPAAGASDDAWALHGMRVNMLLTLLQPWVDASQAAFKEVDQVSKDNPSLANNQLVRTAVLDSRKRLAAGVATR